MSIQLSDDEGFGRVEFAAPVFFASESAGVATVRLVRSLSGPTGKLGSGARVDIVVTGGSATSGVDYTLATGTVTFDVGETTKTFTFPIASDGVAEGPETITLQLQNASGGAGVGCGRRR
jgi:Calx-beta domain-containing protein